VSGFSRTDDTGHRDTESAYVVSGFSRTDLTNTGGRVTPPILVRVVPRCRN
jgi:hypothetical protein